MTRYYSYLLAIFILCLPSSGRAQFQFAPPVFVPTLEEPFFIATGDFNKDSHTDLAVCGRRGNGVSVFLGDGKGGFPIRNDFFLGADYWPTGVGVADMNKDGALDLVTNNYGGPEFRVDSVSILYGDGQGGFATPVEFPTDAPKPSAVAVADFDRDGRLDVAVSNRAGHTQHPGEVTILQQKNPGQFTVHPTHLPGRAPRSLFATDLNGDNNPDLVSANFFPVGDDPTPSISIFLGNGDGTFRTPVALSTRPGPVNIDAADLNEDGFLDLVVANRRGGDDGVSVYIGRPGGNFNDPLYLKGGELPAAVTADDLDEDDHIDIAVINGFSDDLMLYHGNGQGGFTGPTIILFDTGITPRFIESADLDHDGDQDLIIANKEDKSLAVLINRKSEPVGVAITVATVTALNTGVVEISWDIIASGAAVFLYRQSGNAYTDPVGVDARTRLTDAITGPGRHRFVDHDVRIGQTYTYWIEAVEAGRSAKIIGPFIVTVDPPDAFELVQNAPNPFNTGTAITYRIARSCHASLTVYNLLGEEIVTLVDEDQAPGNYTVRWDGQNDQGVTVGSGIYLYTLRAGAFTATRRMLLLK